MSEPLTSVLADLTTEIAQLMKSGENWQIVLHGGHGGDVAMEVKRTRRLVPSRKLQHQRPLVTVTAE